MHRTRSRPPHDRPGPTRRRSEALSDFGVATIHEAMGRLGLMRPYIRPVYRGAKLCGTAVTVLLQPGDNWMLHVAAEQVQEGDVLVAGCTTESEDGFFGELLATSLRSRGGAGLVIDGGVPGRRRPARRWTSPSSAAPSTPRAPSRPPWARSTSRSCAPTPWSIPGDVVVADVDGVVVVPAARAAEVARRRPQARGQRGGQAGQRSAAANWDWTSTPCASRSPASACATRTDR